MKHKDDDNSAEILVEWEVRFDENYQEFITNISENFEEIQSDIQWWWLEDYTLYWNESKDIMISILQDTWIKYEIKDLTLRISEDNLFLVSILKGLYESLLYSEWYQRVKKYFLENPLYLYQLLFSYTSGYNMILIISEDDIWFSHYDEYINNTLELWYNPVSITVFINHLIVPIKSKIWSIEKICRMYKDPQYKEITVKKKREIDEISWKLEIDSKKYHMWQIKSKYPHAKWEFDIYNKNINKFTISEKSRLKRMK